MNSLIKEYNDIYNEIHQLREQINQRYLKIDEMSSRRDEDIPARIEKIKETLKQLDDYEFEATRFVESAKKHIISINLPIIDAPPNHKLEIKRLKRFEELIDPEGEDDPYAKRLYLVAMCELHYIKNKRGELTEKLSELEHEINVGVPAEVTRLEGEIKAIQEQISAFVRSDTFISFSKKVCEENRSRMIESAPVFHNVAAEPAFWIPGAIGTALDVNDEDRKTLKEQMGVFYDEANSRVFLPMDGVKTDGQCFDIKTDKEFLMAISCIPARKRKEEMDAGVRNLILQIIMNSPIGSRKVYVIDALRMNSELVGGLKGIEDSLIMSSFPRNTEMVQSSLEEIVSKFSDIDELLESHDTVAEYNKDYPEKKIDRSLVVLVGWPNSFDGEKKTLVDRIVTNYERYGVSLVVINLSSKNERESFGISDYAGEDMIYISMDERETTITMGKGEAYPFLWYIYRDNLTPEYCSELKKIKKDSIGYEYTDWFDLEKINYIRGRGRDSAVKVYDQNGNEEKHIVLPYGVNGKGELDSLSIDNENFASFLMGASGSGKSTLLHTLITGILMKYHPDDVELWLADFKMVEFSRYINPMPPHIKYILLDESHELVYDLVDKLNDEMMNRQNIIRRNNVQNLEDLPYNIDGMRVPMIYVILDEFSIMSQALEESMEYSLKLQNLLAKGRALGIRFLFASQTYTKGVRGLTSTAKEQIQLRIAMKNSKAEVEETLELSSAQKTEQVRSWMDAFPPFYAMVKRRVRVNDEEKSIVNRAKGLYFNGPAENRYLAQTNMINRINMNMKVVEEYDPSSVDTYVDKHPVVVDGNSFYSFDRNEFNDSIDEYKKSNLYQGDELLLSVGVPRLMSNVRLIALTPESSENLLLIASNKEQVCVASILSSICQELDGKCDVDIWAYERNRIYKTYANYFSITGNNICSIDEISTQILELKNDIINQIECDRLIILLGAERICNEFEFVGAHNASSANVLEDHSEEIAESNMKEYKKAGILAETDEAKWMAENASKIANGEWTLEKYEQEYNKLFGEDTIESEETEKVDNVDLIDDSKAAEDKSSESKDVQKATLDDLLFVIKQGSRLGYHFLVVFQRYPDIKNSGFKEDWFRHRMSFQISEDDSRSLYGKKFASELGQHVCVYSDTIDVFTFRPYLHSGIGWDGWSVKEDGTVESPF